MLCQFVPLENIQVLIGNSVRKKLIISNELTANYDLDKLSFAKY